MQLQRAEKSYQQLLQENTDITQDFNRLSKEKKKKEKELTNKILLLETQVEQLEEKNRELENAKKPQEITDPKSCQFNKRSSESLSKQVTGLKNKKVEGEKQHNVPKCKRICFRFALILKLSINSFISFSILHHDTRSDEI